MTIAERIRLYRQQKGFSQNELAELSEVNNKSLSRYELGTSIPPADALKKIADALSISTDTLLSDDNITIKDKNLLKRFVILVCSQDCIVIPYMSEGYTTSIDG